MWFLIRMQDLNDNKNDDNGNDDRQGQKQMLSFENGMELGHTARSGSVWVAIAVKHIVLILPTFNIFIVF